MLSCSSQQTVGRGETFSQIDFCLPEKPCRPDPTSGRAESDSLIPCLLGGLILLGNGSQSNGGLKSARDAGGARGVPLPGRVPDLRLRSDPSREPLKRPRAAPLGGRAAPEGSAVNLKSR